jgi:hypothetical protein
MLHGHCISFREFVMMKKHFLLAGAFVLASAAGAEATTIVQDTWQFWNPALASSALPANSTGGLLGPTATFLDTTRTNTVTAAAFYLDPNQSGLRQLHDGYVVRVQAGSPPQRGIGVCDVLVSTVAGTKCDTDPQAGDQSQIDGIRYRDVLRLTMPTDEWMPVSLTISDLRVTDKFKVFGSNDPLLDIDSATPLTLTPGLVLDSVAGTGSQVFDFVNAQAFQYLYVTTFDYNRPDQLRVEELVAHIVIPEPASLAMLGTGLLALAGLRRRVAFRRS